MRLWRKRQPDPLEREVEEHRVRSREVLDRVERVLDTAGRVIADYRLAEEQRKPRP